MLDRFCKDTIWHSVENQWTRTSVSGKPLAAKSVWGQMPSLACLTFLKTDLWCSWPWAELARVCVPGHGIPTLAGDSGLPSLLLHFSARSSLFICLWHIDLKPDPCVLPLPETSVWWSLSWMRPWLCLIHRSRQADGASCLALWHIKVCIFTMKIKSNTL